MSSFTWGILKVNNNFECPQRLLFKDEQALCFFNRNTNLFLSEPLGEDEVFFHIACGYDDFVDNPHGYLLNHDEHFFALSLVDLKVDVSRAFSNLRQKIDLFSKVIRYVFNMNGVLEMHLFHAHADDEVLDNYEKFEWNLNDFSQSFFEKFIESHGIAPTLQLAFKH